MNKSVIASVVVACSINGRASTSPGVATMKRIAFGFATLLMTAGAVLAAEPWKTMDTSVGKVYANTTGMTLYTFDKDAANTSNCYDACAAMWPPFLGDKMAKAAGDWTIVTRKN